MVFVLPEVFMAKKGQPSAINGDVEDLSTTPEIHEGPAFFNHQVTEASPVKEIGPSIIVLKDETPEGSKSVASVLFEKPALEATRHIRLLYIVG